MAATHRDRRPAREPITEGRRPARDVLRELAADVDYLRFKESLGEALTPSERARLDAAGAVGQDRAGGGT